MTLDTEPASDLGDPLSASVNYPSAPARDPVSSLRRKVNGALILIGTIVVVAAIASIWVVRARPEGRTIVVVLALVRMVAVLVLLWVGRQINVGITALGRAEMAAREAEHRVTQIIEHIPASIYLKEPKDLRFVQYNKAGRDVIDREPSEVIGRRGRDLFPPELARRFEIEDRRILAGEKLNLPEETIPTRTRGDRILQSRKVAIHDDEGRPVYLLGISEDITDR
ncbi:MAG: PAS domain-containing protein, partial [Gemmatimonadota bacterium]